jgi:hypothetical protein
VNSRDALRRLEAHLDGRPLPRGERLALRVGNPEDVMLLAFVRTGGESRPWGIAFGHPGADPQVLAVPEGRDRDLVRAIALSFGRGLLAHLRSPALVRPAPTDEAGLVPIRQVWLPNASHLDMLHHLAYAYTRTTAGGNDTPALNAIGRTSAWLFREAQIPGEQVVVVATRALKEAFTFPTEDVRQGHLGHLLAWLTTKGGGEARRSAAAEAERRSISTTLDPSIERFTLDPLISAWRDGGRSLTSREARQIETVIGDELRRRFALVDAAWSALRQDPRRENELVGDLVERSLRRQWRGWASTEAKVAAGEWAFIPSVETDWQARGAAMEYLRQSAAADFLEANLLHDDRELLAEAVARGDAFSGTIVQVMDEGVGRTTNPVWTIRDDGGGALRLREEGSVCVVGLRGRVGRIRVISNGPDGERLIEIAINNLKTAVRGATGQNAIAPNDPSWIGQRLTFADAAGGSIAEAKIKKLWADDTPGTWLTQSKRTEPDDDREVIEVA